MSFSLISHSSILNLTRRLLPTSTLPLIPSSSFLRKTPYSHTVSRRNSTSRLFSVGSSNDELVGNGMNSCSSSDAEHELGVSDSDDEEVLEPQLEMDSGDSGERWHVLGLGQAMV